MACVLCDYLQYYLSDDTMELVEVRFDNDGQDPFPMYMSRHHCPKNRDDIEPDFPLGSMEITDEEVKEYFAPVDFSIGKTIVIYGRRFLIYDVDNFTKAFYWKNFGMTDFTPVDVDIPKPPPPKQVYCSSCHGLQLYYIVGGLSVFCDQFHIKLMCMLPRSSAPQHIDSYHVIKA